MSKQNHERVAAVLWQDSPEPHDYPAAAAYLSLVLAEETVARVVAALERGPLTRHKAKDLLRASGLQLLGATDPHVAGDLAKVARGEKLSPVLLVRGDAAKGHPLQIADGYHRVCASYHIDGNTDIPAVLVDLP
ncbi:hypothetical protein JD292_07900 [Leucobacter sp. CSA2]|uniref:ParB/Sulfiredoxin domain-containing protein n=1 Tax=Leucobacter edaphi TaxID=2796472 RepID=A0A934QC99_9MICO|nr:hypothetical protein [Leucobacter edaphi]MBK0421995.1 hypothetical protein [Leucobacter edaphi]